MKVKVDLPGWELYCGKLGGVQFHNGVSVRDVTDKEARRIGGNVRIVNVDEPETQVGGVTVHLGNIPAAPLKYADTKPDEVKPVVVVEEVKEEVVEAEEKKKYTKEELEEVADKGGIKAIREIAKEYDVKGVQIAQLIAGILQNQGK